MVLFLTGMFVAYVTTLIHLENFYFLMKKVRDCIEGKK